MTSPEIFEPSRRRPVGVRLPVPDDWAAAIADFVLDREMAGRPASSRKSYRSALEHLARRTDTAPYQQTRATLRAYVAAHPEWSVETRRARRSTLVAFYDWALEEGHVDSNPARQLPKVRATKPNPKPAPEEAYQRALVAAAPRERLMLQLAHELGMRRDEVARVHSRDLWRALDDSGWILDVHGKGAKPREAQVPDALARQLLAQPEGYLFPGRRDGHLSAEYVGKRIAALLPGEHHMHQLRHSYASRLYQLAGDIVTVQEALGHASPATTMHYVVTDNRSRLRQLNEAMAAPRGLRPTG